MKPPPLNLVVALPAEAKPINRMLGLKRLQPDRTFPMYVQDEIRLVLSGPGLSPAYRASMQLADHSSTNATWLNLGIAGHPKLPLGSPLWIDEVIDASSGHRWQPACADINGWKHACLQSSDQPDSRYAGGCAADMEAAGMMRALHELDPDAPAFVAKIVSDNRRQRHEGISNKLIEKLFMMNESSLIQLFEWLTQHERTG